MRRIIYLENIYDAKKRQCLVRNQCAQYVENSSATLKYLDKSKGVMFTTPPCSGYYYILGGSYTRCESNVIEID